MEYHVYWLLKSWFEFFGDGKYGSFLSQKVDGNLIFTDYWKILLFNFSGMGNRSFFWAKKLMGRRHLLITEKGLVLEFSVMGNTVFFWSKKLMKRWYLLVLLCSDSMGGGLLLYIRDDILMKLLKHDFGTSIENLSVEIDSQKRKWFLNGSYKTDKNKISNHLNYLHLACSKYSKVYDDFIFMGDFNVPMHDKAMEDFCFLNNLERFI